MILSAGIFAQSGPVAAGGNASGANGSVSYSIGQVFYVSATGNGGIATTGLQHPYEFFIVGADNFPNITMEMTAFPNPTFSDVNLKIENQDFKGLAWKVYDQAGNQLLGEKLNSSLTAIPFQDLPSATYFLHIGNNKETVKTFKIIKK